MATGDINNFRSDNLLQGSPLGQVDYTTMLVTSGTNFLMTQGISLIHILSTTSVAANAVFTLQSGFQQVAGGSNQNNILTLVFEAGSSYTCTLANSGNVALTAAWTPTQYQTLTLMWDSALSKWVEIARTPASIGGTALANGDIFVGNASNVATGVAMSGAVTISNAGVTSLAPAIYQTASGSLTQANIQGMHASPVTLIAAAGAGTYIMIDEIEWDYKYNTTAFSGGGVVSIAYATTPTTIVEWAATLITGSSVLRTITRPSVYNVDAVTGTSTGFVLQENQAIVITNASGAFTGGNTASTLEWAIRYHTVTAQA